MSEFHIITRDCSVPHTLATEPDLAAAVAFLLHDEPHEVRSLEGHPITPATIPIVNTVLRTRKADLAGALASVQPVCCPMSRAAHGLAKSLSWAAHRG